MLFVLIKSGVDVIRDSFTASSDPKGISGQPRQALVSLVQCMAASQVVIATMMLFDHHVQVINRISSGYAVWYWWLAGRLVDSHKASSGKLAVISMVMYAAIQGVLFSSFLPPA